MNNAAKIKILLTSLAIFALPLFSFAACYNATGFGSGADGFYQPNGFTDNGGINYTVNGTTGSSWLLYTDSNIPYTLEFNNSTNGQSSGIFATGWYNNTTSNPNPTVGTWIDNGGGTAGTFVLTSCTPPSPTSTEATSTVDQTQSNMFYGFLLFLGVAFSIIAYFQNRFMKGN